MNSDQDKLDQNRNNTPGKGTEEKHELLDKNQEG